MIKRLLFFGILIMSVLFVGMNIPQAQNQIVPSTPTTGIIPKDAIRLRIIANSDSQADQQLKRDVRDKIIVAVAKELQGVNDPATAREKLKRAVPKLNEIAKQVIKSEGFTYSVKTDYGMVPFPTKLYGDVVYPAGNYEALRIQIGKAQGQNWWCVLFPALCFVDMTNADAVVKPVDMQEHRPIMQVQVNDPSSGKKRDVQVRSAFWDKITEWWSELTAKFWGLFSK